MANLALQHETLEARRDKPHHWISLFVALILVGMVLAGAWELGVYLQTEYKLQLVGGAAFLGFWWLFNKRQEAKRK